MSMIYKTRFSDLLSADIKTARMKIICDMQNETVDYIIVVLLARMSWERFKVSKIKRVTAKKSMK